MTIEACMTSRDIDLSLSFCTKVLDFTAQLAPEPDKQAFMSKYALLRRGNSLLHLSSHEGDGDFGNLIYVRETGIEALYEQFVSRGINTEKPNEHPAVTIKLIQQTWSMKEFSVRPPAAIKSPLDRSHQRNS